MVSAGTVRFGEREFTVGGRHLGELRDANALLTEVAALRARLAEDGYLLLRGFHDRDEVLAARREVLDGIAEAGLFDPDAPRSEAVINPREGESRFVASPELTRGPAYRRLVEGERTMAFFMNLFGEPARAFGYKWMRLTGHGESTGAHVDNVYMSRGSERVHTSWTPLGDVPLELGPLAILVGSHRLPSYAPLRETYGRMDVDRDRVGGILERDPQALVERFGGRWATADFRAGDVLVFGMLTMHASLSNVSDRYRLSSDTRYQPAADPMDERWAGETPSARWSGPLVPMERKRAEWGL
jgi:hypothetical protein